MTQESYSHLSTLDVVAKVNKSYISDKRSRDFKPEVDHRLDGDVIKSVKTCSTASCSMKCVNEEECVGFNLNISSNCTCELLSYTSHSRVPITATGWNYFPANPYTTV